MKLSKGQKSVLEEQLSSIWGRSVILICDGYRVTLRVSIGGGLTYRVASYINGVFKGEWADGTRQFPEQKFLRKRTHRMCSRAQKAAAEQAFGKRAVARMPFYNGTFHTYDPTWASGKAAIAHLCRVCESVELASEMDV